MTWIEHPEFLSKISEIWYEPTRDELVLDRVLFKLKKVKKILEMLGLQSVWGLKEKEARAF
jgi:hypothetical protein